VWNLGHTSDEGDRCLKHPLSQKWLHVRGALYLKEPRTNITHFLVSGRGRRSNSYAVLIPLKYTELRELEIFW
jgi:hypothetical protein